MKVITLHERQNKSLDDRIQEEIRVANDYMKQAPCLTRSDALKLAAKHLGPIPVVL